MPCGCAGRSRARASSPAPSSSESRSLYKVIDSTVNGLDGAPAEYPTLVLARRHASAYGGEVVPIEG